MTENLVRLLKDLQDVQSRVNRTILLSEYNDREQYLMKLGADLVIRMIRNDEDVRDARSS